MMLDTVAVTIAANNGSIGGGEVMLLSIAEALRSLDVLVSVVAPTGDGEMSQLADESRARAFTVIGLAANSRVEWMRQLRKWDAREREGILWCNGLVPAAATIGHSSRIVHLHQRPKGLAQQAMFRLARLRAFEVLVPSENMRSAIAGSTVLANWCDDVETESRSPQEQFVIGFLGRPSTDKGVEVLVDALLELDARQPGKYRLALAGTAKFVDSKAMDSVERALNKADHLIERLGWVSRDSLFGQVDVLAVPSIWQEPFGLVAAEAMAAHVPVVVSDAGALPEVVGPDGFVVPSGKPMALADAIEQIAAEGSSVQRQTNALRRRWEEEFSPNAGQARIAMLLESLGL